MPPRYGPKRFAPDPTYPRRRGLRTLADHVPAVPGGNREGTCRTRRGPARDETSRRRVREGACPQAPRSPDQSAAVIRSATRDWDCGSPSGIRRRRNSGRRGAWDKRPPMGLPCGPGGRRESRRARPFSPWRIGGEGAASPGGRFRSPPKPGTRQAPGEGGSGDGSAGGRLSSSAAPHGSDRRRNPDRRRDRAAVRRLKRVKRKPV